MPSTEPQRRDVPIALLYQAQGHSEHLKLALTELGALVVYDSPAAQFDRAALDASGARVVVINLDADLDDGFVQFDELLTDEALHVVFNDAEVSSRLQGSDQARWARHLAAKILGRGELNPPRPPGAEAVPVRVKTQPIETDTASTPDLAFQLHGVELDAALAADTGESLQRTRAALLTPDEPVALELVDPFARQVPRYEAPITALPQPERDPATPSAPVPLSRHDAPTVELRIDAFASLLDNRAESAQPAVAPADDAASGDGFLDAAVESMAVPLDADLTIDTPSGSTPEALFDAGLDGVDELALDFELDPAQAPTIAEDSAAQRASALELDPEFAASLRDFGLLADPAAAAPPLAAAGSEQADADMTLTDEFGEALGALSLEPLDDEAAPPQREAAPAGLDEFLLDLEPSDSPAVEPAASPRAADVAPPMPPKAGPRLALSLADDGAPNAPTPVAPTVEAAVPRKVLSDFDFSGLSLEPIAGEDTTPVTGRARFEIDDKDRRAPAAPAAKAPAAPAPTGEAEAEGTIDFELRGLRTPAVDSDLAAELEAMVAAANALPLGKPVVSGIRNVWVLGASIGGPEAVREFLAAVPPETPALFLLAQHMGADFLDLMVQQLARATPMPVRTVNQGDIARHGEVLVVPLVERLLIDADGTVQLRADNDVSPYSPSIDRVLRDVADRFGAAAGAIIFSGMAHDAVEGAIYLRELGGTVWVQDPATCVISSMVDGAQEAGVVSFVGAPADLARELGVEMARRAARDQDQET